MNKSSQVKKTVELHFKVNKEIVSHLSLGLYRNFARAIKELVSNSYDAGATEVKIKLDLDKAEIIVRDNGRGMDIKDIENKFLTIGYVTAPSNTIDDLGRKRIGTFGIGCLSVFPYCDTVQVITKKRDDDDLIELTIKTQRFFEGVPSDIEKETAQCTIHKSDLPAKTGETIIYLKGIKPHLIKDLRQKKGSGWASIDKFSGFEKFKWTLSQYAPIQFSLKHKELRAFFNEPKRVPMRLWLDGEELSRNAPENMKTLDKGEETFGSVKVKYVITTMMEPVQPEEARGLQVRVRDVAVGLPTDFEVTKFTGKVPGKLNYLSGEVQVLDGLDSALMIDRDNFSYTQEVADMQEFFRRRLIKWNDVLEKWASQDKDIYEALMPLKQPEPIIQELKKADVIHFAKERLRLPKEPVLKRTERGLKSPAEAIRKAISGKGFRVISKKGSPDEQKAPIEVKPKDKSVVVYEDHSEFAETIEVDRRRFTVTYDQWDHKRKPYSICKLNSAGKSVTFNSSHPLFKSKISEDIIKKISLGVLLIARDRKDGEELLSEFNRLLEDVFQG